MTTHNNSVGKISNTNVKVKGTTAVPSTTDKGSIMGLRHLKDNSSIVTSPTNLGSIAMKNWFAEYVGTLGNFNRAKFENNNLKFSDYKGATILGFTVRVVNESAIQYDKNNNAGIKIGPLNGSLTGNPYTIEVGSYKEVNQGTGTAPKASPVVFGTETTFGRVSQGHFEGGNSTTSGQGPQQVIRITDTGSGATMTMTWTPCFGDNNIPTVRGSGSVNSINSTYAFNWSAGTKSGDYSDRLIFLLGPQNTRPYGDLAAYEAS